jgi:predicted transcriptional regulator YheO
LWIFWANLSGPHCEVVLHDLTTPERSVVGIANGYISGRNVGASLTDFTLRLIKEKAHASQDFLHEYEGALKNGRKVRSSTFFIKDDTSPAGGPSLFQRGYVPLAGPS